MRPRPHPRLDRGSPPSLVVRSRHCCRDQRERCRRLRVNYSVNSWNTGFTGNVNVTNLGDAISGGWKLTWAYAGQPAGHPGLERHRHPVRHERDRGQPGLVAEPGQQRQRQLRLQRDYSGTNTAPEHVLAERRRLQRQHVPTTADHGADDHADHDPDHHADLGGPTTGTAEREGRQPVRGCQGLREPGVGGQGERRARRQPDRQPARPRSGWTGSPRSRARPTRARTARWASRDHLDAALAQGAGYIQFVIYDLPGRDCAALASNGELGPNDLPPLQDRVHRPDRRDRGRRRSTPPCGSSTSSRSTRCRTWSPTPPARPAPPRPATR